MNDNTDLQSQFNRLARAVKFGFCTILPGVSYLNFRMAFVLVPQFERIFKAPRYFEWVMVASRANEGVREPRFPEPLL
jgi:hypothetical protein